MPSKPSSLQSHALALESIAQNFVQALGGAYPEQSTNESVNCLGAGREQRPLSIESELQRGLEVSRSELVELPRGWVYKGRPTMVFDYHPSGGRETSVHLLNCPEMVKSNSAALWAVNDVASFNDWSGANLTVCHHCLLASDYKNYGSCSVAERRDIRESFHFQHYVQRWGEVYFPEVYSSVSPTTCWSPGQPLKYAPLAPTEELKRCAHCAWQLPKGSPFLCDEPVYGVVAPVCVCCLDKAPFAYMAPEPLVMKAYAERFWDWKQTYIDSHELGTIESQSLVFSWEQVKQHFPLKWQSLIGVLGEFESANIYCGVEEGFALMAWPRLRRAIVLEAWGKEGFPRGWEVWTHDEVLQNL